MRMIYTTETFRVPQFFRIMCYVMSVLMLVLAGFSISQINTSPMFIFLTFIFLFLAWSMFAYTRLQLIISDAALVLKGGWKPHEVDWQTITKTDMSEVGRRQDLQITVYYASRRLVIARSVFLPRQYHEILLLLEMKLPPEIFTARYQQLRTKPAKQ